MNLTKYQPRNQDEQAIIESRPNRIANIEPKDAFRNVLNVISNLFLCMALMVISHFTAQLQKKLLKPLGR
jgi:hypothetical protein